MVGRKSKYVTTKENSKNKIWKTALYIRLSQEDSDIDTIKRESNSITSQKTLLNEFIEEHDDLLTYDTYIDDGYTGTDFERPRNTKIIKRHETRKNKLHISKRLIKIGKKLYRSRKLYRADISTI